MDLPFGNELPDLDVLIVGAGLSGLTSAVKLLAKENSLNIKIIDESSRPGGQLSNEGTRFVNKDQKEMISFMSQINVTLRSRELPGKGSRCWDLDRGITALPAKFELRRYVNMLDMRMKRYSSSRFTLSKGVPTMERHICSNLFFSQSRNFMCNLVELVSGMAASEIKYDEFMCLCSSCGGLNVLIDIFFVMPNSLLGLSCQQLLERLLEKLNFTEILCNVRAVTVKHFKDYVQILTSSGKVFSAQAVILAIPWEKVTELQFIPTMPKRYLSPRKTLKKPKKVITLFYMRYNKSYWEYQGYSGNFLNIDPLVVGYEGRPTEYSGYTLHTEEDEGSVRDIVLDLLAEQFGEEMQEPLEYKQETFAMSTALTNPKTKPWHRIMWSGSSAGATNNRNLMGGAVESGMRAAVNALYMVRPQVVSWRDLNEVQDKNMHDIATVGRLSGLLSRINLYNFTFYSVFVIGLIFLLNFGYTH